MEFKLVLGVILMVLVIFVGLTAFVRLPFKITSGKINDIFNKNPVADQLDIVSYKDVYYYCGYDGKTYLKIDNLTIKNIGDKTLNVTPYFELSGVKYLTDSCRNVKFDPGEEKNLSCGTWVVGKTNEPCFIFLPVKPLTSGGYTLGFGNTYAIGTYIIIPYKQKYIKHTQNPDSMIKVIENNGGSYVIDLYKLFSTNGFCSGSADLSNSITVSNPAGKDGITLNYEVTCRDDSAKIRLYTSMEGAKTEELNMTFSSTNPNDYEDKDEIENVYLNATEGYPYFVTIPKKTLRILFMDLSDAKSTFLDYLNGKPEIDDIIYNYPEFIIQYNELILGGRNYYSNVACDEHGEFCTD